MSKRFADNRAKFFAKMADNSFLALFAGSAPVKRGDAFYPFEPQRNFLYLTGINAPKLILVMEKKDGKETATLFLERYDELEAKWNGAVITRERAGEISGIDKFKFLDEFYKYIERLLFKNAFETVYIDLENRYFNEPETPDIKFAAKLRKRYPKKNLENAYDLLGELRAIKSEEEIACVQKAVDATGEALGLVLKNLRPGMTENEAEAYFDFSLKKNGLGRGFDSIIAAGKNAAILHYGKNRDEAKDGDLILFDVGAEYNYYSADISRTFPVNGKFSERQKLLYNIVLEANEKVIAAVRPGLPYQEMNKIVLEHYAVELRKIGLIEKDEDIAKYYFHGVGHSLGLETHDTGLTSGKAELAAGMVLTVEPGLYIEEEGIGIRIEDDVLVTESGCEVLSWRVPKTVEEIETAMRRE